MGVRGKPILKNNMAVLKKYHPSIWDMVSSDKNISDNAEIVFSESGKPNLLVKKTDSDSVFIHDEDDPGRESIRFVSMIEEDSHGVVLIFGMGLGYSLLSLIKQRPNLQHIIVFELDLYFFKLALTALDLTEVFQNKRIVFSLGDSYDVDSVLEPTSRALMLEDIHTHKLPTCFQVNEDYELASSKVFDVVSARNIEGATRSHHGKTFIENRLKHLTSMHHNHKLEDLKDKFKDIPALLVAAGPSLDKNIQEIHKAVGKTIIIAVDTALPVLLNHGIKPDFVTSIDYNDPTYEKIAGIASDPVAGEINFICTSWVACTVSKIFPAKNIFWAYGGNAFENWVNRLMAGNMSITGAGTVAHLNFIAAKVMGCDPVVFIGQDLAYSYNQEHAANVVFTGSEPMEKILKDAVWVKGINEDQVPTTRILHGYRVLFEHWLTNANFEGTVINATEGGAWIEGAEHMALSMAIERFCRKDVFVEIEAETKMIGMKRPMDVMVKKVIRVEKIVKKAERLAVSVLSAVKKIKKSNKSAFNLAMLPRKLQKQIFELDGCHNKADSDSLWEMFDEMTMGGLKQNEREKIEIDKLEGVQELYLDWIIKSVERTDRVNTIRKTNLDSFKTQLNGLISLHDRERKLLGRIEKEGADQVSILSLASLYYKNGDYTLLHDLLNKHNCENKNDPEIHFYYGIISLYRCEYDKAEHHLGLSVELNKAYQDKIQTKKFEMAEFYYNWAQAVPVNSFHELEDQNGIYYRLKGLRIFPEHELLQNEFKTLVENDLQRINQGIQDNGMGVLSASRENLRAWLEFIKNEKGASGCISRSTAISFFQLYGKILIDENKPGKAIDNYRQALGIFPDSPELCLGAADVCFAAKDFDAGVQYLKTAVSLDKRYAVYWKNMGDNFQTQKDYQSAILSYEQYYAAFPEKIELLKKIGDCHLKLGDTDSANKAYQKFEELKN